MDSLDTLDHHPFEQIRAFQRLGFGPLAFDEAVARRLYGNIPGAFLANVKKARPSRTSYVDGPVAVIGIHGLLVPDEYPDNDALGLISCERINSDVAAALANPDVREILLSVSSPGGAVMGLDRTAEILRAARSQKRITAFTRDGACSGGYYLASQANELCVSPDSINGSIGIYVAYADYSKAFEKAGIKVEIIRHGAMKGMGTPGTPIPEAYREEKQRIVNTFGEFFISAVALGRRMSAEKVRTLATGAVYLGKETVDVGLADSIAVSFEDVMARVQTRAKSTASKVQASVPVAVADDPDARRKAEFATRKAYYAAEAARETRARATEIIAAFPNDPKFANRMICEGKTLAEAKAENVELLAKEIIAADQQHRLPPVQAKPARIGNPTLPTGFRPGAEEDPLTARQLFTALVNDLVESGVSRPEAVSCIVNGHPDLHLEMLSNPDEYSKYSKGG
jgi:signal peptide peptidase SppA